MSRAGWEEFLAVERHKNCKLKHHTHYLLRWTLAINPLRLINAN